MHIGVDAAIWQNKRGYGRHARALLAALVGLDRANRYTLVADSPQGLDDVPSQAGLRLVNADAPAAVAAAANGHRSLRDMWHMSRALSAPEFDLLLFPTVYSYVPVISPARKLVIIHDVIAEKFARLTLPTPTARLFWKAKVALGRRQADAIITVSDYSRRHIIEHFNLPPERVHVVGEASDPVFRRLNRPSLSPRLRSLGLRTDHRMVAYVGGFGPHKNLTTLVNAFARLAADPALADVRLVMVGENKKEIYLSDFQTIQRQVDRLGLAGRVIFTGFLSDEELVILLNCAAVLALPSLMEGFGLPAVEAAACGCPVVATTASPLPDLLGDGGLYIDPYRQDELEDALRRVLTSPARQQQMSRAALTAAQQLTWEAAARQLLQVIQTVMEQ
ncbi:MAG: glycosyltransferase family 1 protein [Chloroflexi bacterium]|nr:MAG: glycosyltransferase family 1 protein [Chloroflexota bacterium]